MNWVFVKKIVFWIIDIGHDILIWYQSGEGVYFYQHIDIKLFY